MATIAFSINYKKYYPALPPHLEPFATDPNSLPLTVQNKPNWLNVWYVPTGTGDNINIYFQVQPSNADVLAPGSHTATVKIIGHFGVTNVFSVTQLYAVTINVTDTILLAVTPTNMYFNHVIGNPVPADQNLNITSENSWLVTKDQSWITLSSASGVNSSNISIGVDPTGLAVGNYTGTVTVNDGVFIRNVIVNLVVTNETTPTEYLTISPLNIEFVETQGVASTAQKNISIDASAAWTAVKTQAWLLLDINSGGIGISTIVATVNSDALAVGVYYDTIQITTASIIKTVNVVLRVTAIAASGIVSGGLYFADDRNVLTVSNTAPNTFAYLDVLADIISETINYFKKAPFFRGFASIFIGTETENLLQTSGITNNLATRIFTPIKPISFGLTLYDKVFYSNQTTLKQSFTGIKFLNGKTPTVTNKLCYIPQTIATTKDAVIALSFMADDAPTSIEITGDVTQSIGAVVAQDTVYTAIVNLANITLSVGDNINIAVGGQSVNVTIKSDDPEHTLLAFENEWQCPEMIMLTGKLTITSNKSWDTTIIDNNGDEHEKIIEAKHPISFTINTGWIYSQEEVDWLDRMFTSKKFTLFIKGVQIEVVPTTSKMVPYETRNRLRSYNLTFKKAIV